MNDLAKAKEAAERTAGIPAVHAGTEDVVEIFQGKVIWQGRVEVFAVPGHPDAEFCYAWEDRTEGREGYVAVLGTPPVQSAQDAVKAYIIQVGRS